MIVLIIVVLPITIYLKSSANCKTSQTHQQQQHNLQVYSINSHVTTYICENNILSARARKRDIVIKQFCINIFFGKSDPGSVLGVLLACLSVNFVLDFVRVWLQHPPFYYALREPIPPKCVYVVVVGFAQEKRMGLWDIDKTDIIIIIISIRIHWKW